MSWVAIGAAVAGAVVSAGAGAAVSSSQQPDFGGAKPAPFNPVDIPQTQFQALGADIKGYDLADKDLAKRFPGLVAGRSQQIDDAYKQLTGPLDPSVQNSFLTRSIENSLGTTGGGDSMSGLDIKGGAGGNFAATGFANQVLQKQDSDRDYFDTLLQANPQRAFGLSGSDTANLSIANTQNLNQYNQAKYQYQTQKSASDSGGGP